MDQPDPNESLPPGASTKDDDGLEGSAREAAPYDEAPAEGRLAPDADNPAPSPTVV